MRNLYGYGGVALMLAGCYLLFGVAVTLILAGLIFVWVAIRMDDSNATDT
jgi:hypothetical protein